MAKNPAETDSISAIIGVFFLLQYFNNNFYNFILVKQSNFFDFLDFQKHYYYIIIT